jgi:S-adenosylmethionine hydrolase
MKTTITVDDLKGSHSLNDMIKVTIGKATREVKYVKHMFAAHPGELVIFPGSSGLVENPYLEVSVWRHFDKGDHHTGAHEFDYPKPGDKITLK